MNTFQFNLGGKVTIKTSGESGEIIGRADYKSHCNSYMLRYKAADGRAVEGWWEEDSLQIEI